jgi:hypothetical protein
MGLLVMVGRLGCAVVGRLAPDVSRNVTPYASPVKASAAPHPALAKNDTLSPVILRWPSESEALEG